MDVPSEHPDLNYHSKNRSLFIWQRVAQSVEKLSACNVYVPVLEMRWERLRRKVCHTIIITAGQQELGHGLTEPLLYDLLVPMAEPLVKWAVEVTRLQDLPHCPSCRKNCDDTANGSSFHFASWRYFK